MTYPLQRNRYGSYEFFASEIAAAKGHGHDYGQLDRNKLEDVDRVLQRGLMQFYIPPPNAFNEEQRRKAAGYKWSFLCPTASLSLTSGTATYALPADFSGRSDDFTTTTSGSYTIPIVSETHLRQIITNAGRLDVTDVGDDYELLVKVAATSSGTPIAAAISPVASTGETPQKYEVLFYPTPDAAITVQYDYEVEPQPLSNDQFPLGGQSHVETILSSCLAIVEGEMGAGTRRWEEFSSRITASLLHDIEVKDQSSKRSVWPLGQTTTDLGVDYFYLQRQVGNYMEYGWNAQAWSHAQANEVDEIISEGCRWYYHPPPIPGMRRSWEWSFMRPLGEIQTSANQRVYPLPEDFEHFIEDITYQRTDNDYYTPIIVVSESKIRQLDTDQNYTTYPQFAAIRPIANDGSKSQRQELILHPTPDSTYTLNYRYQAIQRKLSPEFPFPMGGHTHASGILTSCLAVAELRKTSKPGPLYRVYMDRLAAAIATDMQRCPDFFGYNGNGRGYFGNSRAALRRQNAIFSRDMTYLGQSYD